MRTRTLRGVATVAALLPWLTWVLPIYSFETERFADEAVSLAALLTKEPPSLLFVPILAMAVLAIVAWVRRPGIVWAVLAAVVAASTVVLLAPLGEGVIMWDGEDAQGRPIGGSEVLGPDWGWWVMVLSLGLWVLAFVLVVSGLRKGRSEPPADVLDHGSDTMAG